MMRMCQECVVLEAGCCAMCDPKSYIHSFMIDDSHLSFFLPDRKKDFSVY